MSLETQGAIGRIDDAATNHMRTLLGDVLTLNRKAKGDQVTFNKISHLLFVRNTFAFHVKGQYVPAIDTYHRRYQANHVKIHHYSWQIDFTIGEKSDFHAILYSIHVGLY